MYTMVGKPDDIDYRMGVQIDTYGNRRYSVDVGGRRFAKSERYRYAWRATFPLAFQLRTDRVKLA